MCLRANCLILLALLQGGLALLQERASPADQVLAMRRIRGDKRGTIAAMHSAVNSVSNLHRLTKP